VSGYPTDQPQSGYDDYDAKAPGQPALGNPDFVPGSKHRATEGRTS
jgi:hypothetical protein